MCEVVAGAGAHEGLVGCVWDGDGTLRGGRARQRGWGMSRGMRHVLGGHGATHRVSPSVGRFAWTRGGEDVWLGSGRMHISMGAMGGATSWLLQSRARMRILRGQQKLST